jgi:hypothetical protein
VEQDTVTNGSIRYVGNKWILKPNTEYYRTDGTLIDTTNSNGWFVFPFNNSFCSNCGHPWTGLNSDGGVASNNCISWTSNSAGNYGTESLSNEINSASINGDILRCSLPSNFYCVEQS